MSKELDDALCGLNNFLNEIRPLLIKKYHEEYIEDYKAEYSERKNGEMPDDSLINHFSTYLIANQLPSKKADEIFDALRETVKSSIMAERKSKRFKFKIVNTFVFGPFILLMIQFILGYFSYKLNLDFFDPNIYSYVNIVSAIYLLLVGLGYYIHTLFEK